MSEHLLAGREERRMSLPPSGPLIALSGTDDVASAYAATYPITLIGVVISSQFLVLLLS